VKALLSLLFLAALCSCGHSPDRNANDSAHRSDSAAAGADRRDLHSNCCFQNESAFSPFLPDSCGKFQLHGTQTEMNCGDDTLRHSTVLANYVNAEDHIVTVRITEYCTTPAALNSDYLFQFGLLKGAEKEHGEFNEFDVPASHRGFSTFDYGNRTAGLVVMVDNRFLVEIKDQVCENTKNVLVIYESLPLKELAAFGR
jgi:hypothetical protein